MNYFPYKTLVIVFLASINMMLSTNAEMQAVTLSPLPEYQINNEREDSLTIGYDPSGVNLVGSPGETVGWIFNFSWSSNAGDCIIFSSSTLEANPESISTTGYYDLIGESGGNQNGRVLAGTQWLAPQPAVPGSHGVGYLAISTNAEEGTIYEGTLNINLTVYDMADSENPVRLGSFTIPVAVTVTVVAKDLQDQTITLADIPERSVTSSPFPITATASSQLPVNVVSLTPQVCTIENGIATVHSAGNCMIFATQEGNTSYRTAPPVYTSFIITKNEASVVIHGNLDQSYDGNDKLFTATTQPEGLNVDWLYNGIEAPPREPGIHIIDALIDDPTYTGKAQARLIITDNRPAQLTNYNAWLEANFSQSEILDGALTGWNQEPAGDSQINLMKYAMGFDARTPASPEFRAAFPKVANPSIPGSVIFELPAIARADLSLRVQATSNLVDWEEIARRDAGNPWTGSAEVFSGTATPDGTRIPILVTEPQAAGVNRFYRLQVSPFP